MPLGYSSVYVIHRTLTWTTGSLTWLRELSCMCRLVIYTCSYTHAKRSHTYIRKMHMGGLGLSFVSSEGLFKSCGSVCIEFDTREVSWRAQAIHVVVTHPCGDYARLYLTWLSERERVFSACTTDSHVEL